MFTVQPQARVASREIYPIGGRAVWSWRTERWRVYSLADGTDGVDGVLT